MDGIDLQEARILRIQPGDVVVFETESALSPEHVAQIKSQLSDILAQAGHDEVPTAVVSQGKLMVARVTHLPPGDPPPAPPADPEVRG